MTNRKRIFITLSSIMVLAFFCAGIATAAEEIRIGFTPPITGTHAA